MTTAFPPIRHHTSRRINTDQAQKLVAAYLEASLTESYLHPNALLTENGPTTTSSAANTGLVLHNLKRVEAGLRGEHLGIDLAFGRRASGGEQETLDGVEAIAHAEPAVNGGETASGEPVQPEEGWQDRSEFEREQDDVHGDVGNRNPAEGGKAIGGPATKAEKEARKQAKKERVKKERRRLEEQKRREREAEEG